MNALYDNVILSQKFFEDELMFWKNTLGDDINQTYLFDINNDTEEVKKLKYTLDKEISEKLNKLTNNSPMALFVAILAAYKIYVSKLTNNKKVTIFSPIIGDKEKCKYNDIVMLYDKIDTNDTFKDVLIKVKESVINSYKNQDYPLEAILKEYSYESNISEISDFMVMMDGIHKYDIESAEKMKLIMQIKKEEAISLEYTYNKSLTESEVEDFSKRFINVLRSCVDNLLQKVKTIQVVEDDEKEEILKVVNSSEKKDILFNSVKQYFEETVSRNKDKAAVKTTKDAITYDELNKKANQFAHKLQSEGVKKGDIVGICLEPSVEVMISIMAVIKMGSAYLPIDLGVPNERLKYIINDSNMKLLISSKENSENDLNVEKILCFDDCNLNEFSDENLDVEVSSEDVLYIIYTSGTTGLPKGVKVLNRGLLNYIDWFKEYADIKSSDKTALISSYAFDLGYTVLYSSILSGCELNLLTKNEYANPEFLLSYIADNKITYLKATPSLFKIISGSDKFQEGYFSSVRLVLLGGENIDLADIMNAHMAYPNLVIANHYGPTESTIGIISTKIDFDKFEEYCKCPVLGKAITNANVYVLNDDLNLMPLGSKGELYISGKCLSGGYLNNEKLTKEKFIVNPYNPNELLYKTSDYVKLFNDGNVLFLGRSDNQVKIHGYRVEIGEIEYALKLYSTIDDAVVIVKKDDNDSNYICSYVISNEELDIAELRKFLSNYIADYMIPKYFVKIDKIPLTINGKVDYRALPEPVMTESNAEYAAPRNEVEKDICEAWEEVLKNNKIGINDDFFVLGGDSIKAIQVASKLQKIGYNVELKDIVEYTTISTLVENVINSDNKAALEVAATCVEDKTISDEVIKEINEYYNKHHSDLKIEEIYNVTPMQKGIYEHNVLCDEVSPGYQNRTCKVNYEFDINILRQAYQLMIDEFQILRTNYYKVGENVYQVSFEHREAPIEFHDISSMNEEEQKSYLAKEVRNDGVKGFDLTNDMLMRLIIYKLKQGSYFVLWTNHHITLDGWSRIILLKKLFKNIRDLKEGNKITIEPANYSDYVKDIEERDWNKAANYWHEYLKGYKSTQLLKRREDARPQDPYVEDSVAFEIDEEYTKHLNDLSTKYKVTFYTIILAMWGKFLQKINNKDEIVFGSLMSDRNRNLVKSDESKLVGAYINIIPIRMKNTNEPFEKQLRDIQKQTILSYEHGYFFSVADKHFSNFDDSLMESAIACENYPMESIFKNMFQGNDKRITDVTIYDSGHGYVNIGIIPFETTLVAFSFNKNIYSKEYMESIAKQFNEFLHTL